MTAIISYLVAIPLLAIASYTDLKTRTASNKLWLIMGIAGVILLFFSPFDLLYFLLIVMIVGILLAMFSTLPVGGADIKALITLAILFPYPLGNGFLPPLYSIFLYSSLFTLGSIPFLKIWHRQKSFKDLLTTYRFPFMVSLLAGVIILFFIGDITDLLVQ